MSDFEQTPPRTLGLNIEQVWYAANNGVVIRFWPERDAPCQPHVGRITAWQASAVPFSDAVKLTVSLGYIMNAPATHCEFADELEPDSRAVESNLSTSMLKLGDLAKKAGDLDEARRMFDAALAGSRNLVAQEPTSVNFSLLLAVSVGSLGDLAMTVGHLEEARWLREEARRLREERYMVGG